MRKNTCLRLLSVLLWIGLLCSCSAAPEEQNGPVEAKAKRSEETSPPPIECRWIDAIAEIPPGDPELNGRLWDGPMPEGVDLRNRIYTDGEDTMDIIDLDGNLVRWGCNWNNHDAGWNQEDGIQPYAKRNVLLKNTQKVTWGFRATLALDSNQDLWGWGPNYDLLLYDGNPYYPPREAIKVLSGVKDIDASDFYVAAVRTDGRLQVWGRDYPEPKTIQTGVEKICSADTLMYIDQQCHLYYYPDGWSKQQKPKLLGCDIDDISLLGWNFFLERKTDGSVWIANFDSDPVLLAEDSKQLAYDGYITPDGTFWSCRQGDGFSLTIQPMDSVCSILGGGSIGDVHIMKDGEIRFCRKD